MSRIRSGQLRRPPQMSQTSGISAIMLDVLVALIPAWCMAIFLYGFRVVVLTAVSVATCVLCEYWYERLMKRPITIYDLSASSYGSGTESSGQVKLKLDLADDISGRDVLIIEDIVDSGNTLSKLLPELQKRGPASLKVCALLDKPERRVLPFQANYVGFTIPDAFVVGYGLDFDQHYRQLPYIGVLKPSVYE